MLFYIPAGKTENMFLKMQHWKKSWQVLSRWYDIAVFYKREEVKKLHFTGDLERYKTINDFLEFMEIGGNVRFSIKGKTVLIE